MFRKTVLGVVFMVAFVFASNAYAGKVELTTYYPAPYGEYKNLKSTEDSNFATTSGKVGIGTATPAETLDVNGNIKASGGIQVGYTVACGAAGTAGNTRYNPATDQMEYCNQSGSWQSSGGSIKIKYCTNAQSNGGDPDCVAAANNYSLAGTDGWKAVQCSGRVEGDKASTLHWIATAPARWQYIGGDARYNCQDGSLMITKTQL